jgi:predicted DNA-binding transcriptional regulator AlpA
MDQTLQQNEMPERMLDTRALSALTSISEKTLRQWVTNWETHRKGPRPTKLGPHMKSRVRYRLSDVREWQQRCARGEYGEAA